MDQHVVVGYDGSPESVSAVRWAARSAARLGRPLDVVHVWGLAGQLDLPPRGEASEYVRQGAQEVADEGAALAREAAPDLPVTAVLEDGAPAAALVAHSRDATLLVLGRHGAGRLSGAVLGSVSLGAVHHALCPVVVVPRAEDDHRPAQGSVVVGVDGSAGALGALDAAGRYATNTGSALTVVSAWEAPAKSRTMSYWLRAYPDASPGELALQAAEDAQAPARTWLASTYPHVTASFAVDEGRPTHVLARYAEHADLLVVGTRGRGGLTGLVLGSVSGWLVQHAACPVLVTRVPVT